MLKLINICLNHSHPSLLNRTRATLIASVYQPRYESHLHKTTENDSDDDIKKDVDTDTDSDTDSDSDSDSGVNGWFPSLKRNLHLPWSNPYPWFPNFPNPVPQPQPY